ncbi:MAG: hypothetical protein AABY32_03210 [Nanoarchaeota archaeon]
MAEMTENKFWETDYTKNWKHRAQGLAGITLAGISIGVGLKEPESIPLIVGGTLLAIDGLGDIITGYHHYCGQKAIEGIKYISNKFR